MGKLRAGADYMNMQSGRGTIAHGFFFFFFNDTATTEIYTVSALFPYTTLFRSPRTASLGAPRPGTAHPQAGGAPPAGPDRKSTRLNSSHLTQSRMPSSA